MNVSTALPMQNAYATLARLKIALPLTQAAMLRPRGDAQSTVVRLIDLTRELTEHLASAAVSHLSQVASDRRDRLMRSLAQEVAYLIGRAHERDEPLDAGRLIEQVKVALASIDAVPGARISPFFTETLDQKAQWQLAVIRAASRLAESMVTVLEVNPVHIHNFLNRLLAKVEQEASGIETRTDEESRTVRVSLLAQFSKSHARLIAHRITQDHAAKRPMNLESLFNTIDAYHTTLAKALYALAVSDPAAAHDAQNTGFTPEL